MRLFKPKSAYTILTPPTGEVLFLGRRDPMTLPKGTYFPVGLLELPGGTHNPIFDRSMEQTAIRETEEETGLRLNSDRLIPLGSFGDRVYFYSAQITEEEMSQVKLSSEHINYRLLTFDQLVELGFRHDLKDEQFPIKHILPLHADITVYTLLSNQPEQRHEFWRGFDGDFKVVPGANGEAKLSYIPEAERESTVEAELLSYR